MGTDFGVSLADQLPDAAIVSAADGTLLQRRKGAEATFAHRSAEAPERLLSELIVGRLYLESRVQRRPRD